MAEAIGYCFFSGVAHGFTGLGCAVLILSVLRKYKRMIEEV